MNFSSEANILQMKQTTKKKNHIFPKENNGNHYLHSYFVLLCFCFSVGKNDRNRNFFFKCLNGYKFCFLI